MAAVQPGALAPGPDVTNKQTTTSFQQVIVDLQEEFCTSSVQYFTTHIKTIIRIVSATRLLLIYKIKQSRHRLGVAQRIPGSVGSHIS
jgi:hypothetical protein